MNGVLPCALTTVALLVATSVPVVAQSAPGSADIDRDRAAAERALDRSGRLRWMGTIGSGMSLAAALMSDEQMSARGGTALAVGGITAVGLGLIGDFGRHRAKSRLDALNRAPAGGLDDPARAEAERALRRGGRLSLFGDIATAMFVAVPFFPAGHRCGYGSDDTGCSAAAKAYLVGAVAAGGVGLVGLFKTRRAENRLEALEMPKASHGFGVAPLPDGVAANYSVAW